jgi:CRISPR/Cas system-associated protein Cas10 (large subunit of type III CRISPR-Cas system)
MKKFIRQWLCEHKHTTTLRKIETTESLPNLTGKKTSWFPANVLRFKLWYRCDSCGKVLTWEHKL